MYPKNQQYPQYSTRPQYGQPDDTQRPIQRGPKPSFANEAQPLKIPGSKSLHLYNTLLLVFAAIQLALYLIQGVTSQCPELGTIFYGFAGVYLYTLMVPVILWLCVYYRKGYTFATIWTIGAMLGKVGVVIAIFLATQNHVGLCYVASDVKIGVAIANIAEALCMAVQLLFIRQAVKIQQLKEVQMFMDAGQRKGLF